MKDIRGILGFIFSLYGLLSFVDMSYEIIMKIYSRGYLNIPLLAGNYYFLFSIIGFIISINKKTKLQSWGFYLGLVGIALFLFSFLRGILA